MERRSLGLRVLSVFAIAFGLLTLKSGGAVVFDASGARAEAGNYLPFVVWFNFLAGFFYIAAGVGLWRQRRWAVALAAVIAVATGLVFAAFGIHVASGGAYEMRTAGAMTLRLLLWSAIALYAWYVTPSHTQDQARQRLEGW